MLRGTHKRKLRKVRRGQSRAIVRQLQELKQADGALRVKTYELQRRQEEILQLKILIQDELKPLAEKIAQVQMLRDYSPELGTRYRLLLDISPMVVEDCLMHGNSDGVIRAICENIGARAYHEIKTINFRRLGEYTAPSYRYGRPMFDPGTPFPNPGPLPDSTKKS